MKDCYKTKILPAPVYLKTADGSSMSLLVKQPCTIALQDFKILTYFHYMWLATTNWYFILHRTLEEILYCIVGIQINNYSYREGSFLTYTRKYEQQHNIAVVKYTLKIPLRHNGAISIKIKGHKFKGSHGIFISNQLIIKGLHPNIHVIDGIYNTKGRSTLHILVGNYTNKHVTFNKGQCIGIWNHPLTICHRPLSTVSPHKRWYMNIFNQTLSYLPYIPSWIMWGNHSINCWRHLNHNLHKIKQVLAQ